MALAEANPSARIAAAESCSVAPGAYGGHEGATQGGTQRYGEGSDGGVGGQ